MLETIKFRLSLIQFGNVAFLVTCLAVAASPIAAVYLIG